MSQQKQRRRSQRAIATTTTTATLLLIVVVLSLSVAAGPQPAEAASVALPSSLKAHAKAALRPILARARALIEAAEAATGAAEAPAAASEASRPQPTKPAAAAEEGDDVAAAAAAAFDSITGGAGSSGSVGSGSGVRGHGLGVGDDAGGPEGPGRIRMLSWEPRAMLWEGFMTEEEADHIVSLGSAHLIKSDVVDADTGDIVESKERTSSGYFLPRRGSDPVVARLEERIARWSQVPVGNGEPFHLLRYNPAEEYTAHFDYFFDKVHVQNGGQRLATVILYLSEVAAGGETVFPDSPTRLPMSPQDAAGLSACARKGLVVRPRKRDALLFFSLKPDGQTQDVKSLHAGCPVISGTKWIATKWMRVGHYHDWGSEGPQEDGHGRGADEQHDEPEAAQQQDQQQQDQQQEQRDEL